MNENVSILQLFPGIPASTVRTFLSAPMQGVILETFGAGNPPQRKDLMDAIKEACDRGVVSRSFCDRKGRLLSCSPQVIVNISQCPRGSVSPVCKLERPEGGT
jgi:lysophospholipase